MVQVSQFRAMRKVLSNAFLAGVMLGIAGTVYLSVENKVIGSFLFGFGLLIILCYEFKLFTGAVGYTVNNMKTLPSYLWFLLLIWSGNFLGTSLVGWMIRQTRLEGVMTKAQLVCEAKLTDSMSSIFVLAVLCGVLMYLAVESYRSSHPAVMRFSIVFLCVSIFILSGFEHCIANMFYFSVSGLLSLVSLQYIAAMTLGNAVGGMFIPLMDKVRAD